MSQDLITNLYNAFASFQPLLAKDALYVNLDIIRGDTSIIIQIGKTITSINSKTTCQVYAGHRGAGKSTELFRLKDYLEQQGYVVIYASMADYIELQDIHYANILIASIYILLNHILLNALDLHKINLEPFLSWIKKHWKDIEKLGIENIDIENLQTENIIDIFYHLIMINNIGNFSQREKLREIINPYSVVMIDSINQILKEANLSQFPLVFILDDLDKMSFANGENIFFSHANLLKKINCHIVYTIPLSLLYSFRAMDIRYIYDNQPFVLPIIMIKTPDGKIFEKGINVLKEIIYGRILSCEPNKNLESDIFENAEIVEEICLMSGGNIRQLLGLVQSAFRYTLISTRKIQETNQATTITNELLQRIFRDQRSYYLRAIGGNEWGLLIEVHRTKAIKNKDDYRDLLFNGYILEYVFFDNEEEMQIWYDVNPLIQGIMNFETKPDLLIPMDEASRRYDKFISEEKYSEASQIADSIYKMYEDNVESLKSRSDSDEYINAVAWSSYWKLRRDLYKSRSLTIDGGTF